MTRSVAKIKLLIAVPSLECGGLERNVSLICNHINTDLFHVTLAVINNSQPFYTINNPAIRIVDLQCSQVRKSIFLLRKLAKETSPDIILTTANHLNLLFAMFRWLFPKKIKIIARESSIVSINSKRAKMPALYDRLLMRFYKNLDLIICQSAYMQTDLVQHYQVPKEKTIILQNAVQVPMAKELVHPASPVAMPQLITVARLSEEKGIDRILRSLAKLTRPFHFTIIGEGNQRAHLQTLINELNLQEMVSMPGARQHPFSLIKDPSLFLMGSLYEGFPNVLLEANALGIPLVAFDAPGGIAEVINPLSNGLLVMDGNEDAYAAAIETALSYPFNHRQIQADTLLRYDPTTIISLWEAQLVQMIK